MRPRTSAASTEPVKICLCKWPESVYSTLRLLGEEGFLDRLGYRRSEIARHVGVHYSTISRWLREHEKSREKDLILEVPINIAWSDPVRVGPSGGPCVEIIHDSI
ncbi:MAG TPA: hypothetical protein DCS42_15610 [Nitrospiraceae bacterium]|jgi:Homeodomain-like domain|nr:hypothetical protein [Nitrospiraceae bacterium]HAS55449.1 hypothetical protein [Nitrospiraceae bacterium]